MTSKEYVIWLHGFVEACNEYAPTPKQWDTLKDKLNEVADPVSLPIGVPNTTPSIWQHPHYVDPYKITCATGSSGTMVYNPSTTTQMYPSGSAWSYTTTLPQQPTTGSNQLELDFEPK